MKFNKLEATNFLTLSHASVRLNDMGLHVIQGVNDDDGSSSSNGAGKSSLVDALCWCLWGTTARGVKGDAVINLQAKKGTMVVTTLARGETTYEIARYRKHAEFKNSLRVVAMNGETRTDLSRGTDAETQKEVERILGCSYDVFVAAVYSGQEIMPDLPRMTDRELKRLIEEAAGLEQIERAYDLARTKSNAADQAVSSFADKIGMIQSRITRDETALELRRANAADWDAARAGRIERAEGAVAAAKERFEAEARALLDRNPKVVALREAVAVIDKTLADHSRLENEARAAEAAVTAADRKIQRTALENAVNAVTACKRRIENAAEEMAKPCGECGKPHTADELDAYVAHQRTQLARAEADLAAIKATVTKQLQDKKAAETEAAAKRALVPDVSAVQAERGRHMSVIETFDADKRRVEALKREKVAAEVALEAVKSEANPHLAVVSDLEARIAEDAAERAALGEKHAQAEQAAALARSVVKVFGPAGVRAEILDTVTPFLNDKTAHYLAILSDGAIQATWTTLTKSASGDLKEKFSIEVTHAKGGDSFSALSGGEKRKVRLACALALQDLVASRATQPIDLWIGDEIDDALDPAGLERLMTILEMRARARGTVLVISHNSLTDWCDEVTLVRKSGGVSTVEGSLCK